ncbi:hypothetical protein PP484_gp64 [Gordonia phage Madeline]|uniref:Uncharacterized protein n=2 Tax=Nymbaxtervirinae TaxID=2169601 RepID=A0A7G8LGA6_9CAUD|nr:hypothetical protein PP484_gp64 [Gordonia phage Madeline]YP_010653324.1 hypothetical protein PP492_gp49 [Gordonia phage Ohgeesy]QDH47649.1 hypothetical protein SEA_MADELINE_46 [Gordonia phage Madeline]QNJ56278.1 hypothetical protein SEA_OHGEESY_49 [Gordonia phage Ohgeesy]
MSHFAFHAEPTPVATRHGDCYIGVGESTEGVESIGIVTPGDDSTDLHLSLQQALVVMAELTTSIAVLIEHRRSGT